MSDYYLFEYSFGLDPYLSAGAVRAFQSLARSEPPDKADLRELPRPLQSVLSVPDELRGGSSHQRAQSPLRMTPLGESTEFHDYAKSPEWEVAFGMSVHDDWYANGAYAIAPAIFDVVGENGLFCTEVLEGDRGSVVLHYREDDDYLVLRVAGPPGVARLRRDSRKSRADVMPDWRPAQQDSFGIESLTRVTTEMRERMFAEVEEMFRDAGWEGES